MSAHPGSVPLNAELAPPLSLLPLWVFLLISSVTRTAGLFVDLIFTKSHVCFPLCAWGRVFEGVFHLRKDGTPAFLSQG